MVRTSGFVRGAPGVKSTCLQPYAVAALFLLVSSGCDQGLPDNPCRVELAAVRPTDSASVDIELLMPGIVDQLGAEPYWSDVPSIATACQAPKVYPGGLVRSQANALDRAKAVARFRTGEVSGILFAYPSQGMEESVTGIAVALVEYPSNGVPGRVYKASELLNDEGWGHLTKSRFLGNGIERCTQEIAYVTYADNGDILGELAVPNRSPPYCEQIVQFPR